MSSSAPEGAPSAEEPATPEQEAAELKKRGNDSFVQGQYGDAATLYSEAIAKDPSNHVSAPPAPRSPAPTAL